MGTSGGRGEGRRGGKGRAKNPRKTLPLKKCLRAFLKLIRYSNKGLLVLIKYLKRKTSTVRR